MPLNLPRLPTLPFTGPNRVFPIQDAINNTSFPNVDSIVGLQSEESRLPPARPENIGRSRLEASGLPSGAEAPLPPVRPRNVQFAGNDTRVKISDPSGVLIGSAGVLTPLRRTGNKVIFPYTPEISLSHQANYSDETLTHSNYAYLFYQNSTVSEISISGQFSAQTNEDAQYVLAVQNFFRAATKMFYGSDVLQGLPPIVLRLDGHGDYQFSSVPVVITNFSTSLPSDVDYITAGRIQGTTVFPDEGVDVDISPAGSETRVPTLQTFNVTCRPLYSRRSASESFNYRAFASGNLLANNSRGGFI